MGMRLGCAAAAAVDNDDDDGDDDDDGGGDGDDLEILVLVAMLIKSVRDDGVGDDDHDNNDGDDDGGGGSDYGCVGDHVKMTDCKSARVFPAAPCRQASAQGVEGRAYSALWEARLGTHKFPQALASPLSPTGPHNPSQAPSSSQSLTTPHKPFAPCLTHALTSPPLSPPAPFCAVGLKDLAATPDNFYVYVCRKEKLVLKVRARLGSTPAMAASAIRRMRIPLGKRMDGGGQMLLPCPSAAEHLVEVPWPWLMGCRPRHKTVSLSGVVDLAMVL